MQNKVFILVVFMLVLLVALQLTRIGIGFTLAGGVDDDWMKWESSVMMDADKIFGFLIPFLLMLTLALVFASTDGTAPFSFIFGAVAGVGLLIANLTMSEYLGIECAPTAREPAHKDRIEKLNAKAKRLPQLRLVEFGIHFIGLLPILYYINYNNPTQRSVSVAVSVSKKPEDKKTDTAEGAGSK
jgi:hypothetical protein